MTDRRPECNTLAKISALLREQTIDKLPPIWLTFPNRPHPWEPIDSVEGKAHIKESLNSVLEMSDVELIERWPQNPNDRIRRFLKNLVQLSAFGGARVKIRDDNALAFAVTGQEARWNVDALTRAGLIDSVFPEMAYEEVYVTPDGWNSFEESRRTTGSRQNPAFVAMWFGEPNGVLDMTKVYRTGIALGIREAGYDETRVDIAPHNDYIMNKVLGDIRVAPFVVADFTGNRNGVYFEAGFARGLGIPVINTCHKDHFGEAHFDTKQLNHIIWSTEDELRNKLREHIRGTLGPGPFKDKKATSSETAPRE